MRINKIFSLVILVIVTISAIIQTSCDTDEPKSSSSSSSSSTSTTKISKPTLEKDLTTTTFDDITFRCRFNNGGDSNDNMKCTVHWTTFSSKPKSTPTSSKMTKHESMRQYGGGTYKAMTFDKAHTGMSGGTYIYYYFECSNSKGTTKTNVTFTIIKRL